LYFAEIIVLGERGEAETNKNNRENEFPHEESPQKIWESKIRL
jgi:hypothetical protein